MTTGYSDPDGDIVTQFVSTEETNYEAINEGVRQPATLQPPTGSDESWIGNVVGSYDAYSMSSFDLGGGTISQIKLWIYYGNIPGDDGALGTIYVNGYYLDSQDFGTGSYSWKSITFTPATSWNQTDLDNLKVILEFSAGDPPGIQIMEMYAEITYTAGGGGGTNCQINIGDAWKAIAGIQINIGDVWKPVTGMKINIGDVWKTIF